MTFFNIGLAQNPSIQFSLDPVNYSNNAPPPSASNDEFFFSVRSLQNGFYGWHVRVDLDSFDVHVTDLNPIWASSPSRPTIVEGRSGQECLYVTPDSNQNLVFATHYFNGPWSFDTVPTYEIPAGIYRAVQLTANHVLIFWWNSAMQSRIWVVDRVQKTVIQNQNLPEPQPYAMASVIDSCLIYFSGYNLPNSLRKIGIDGTPSWMPFSHNLPAIIVPQTVNLINGSIWFSCGYQDNPATGFPTSSPALGMLDSSNHVSQLYHLPYSSLGSVNLRGHYACPQDQAHYITYHVPYGSMAQFDSVILVRLDPGMAQNDTLIPTWKKSLGVNQQYQNSGVFSDGIHVLTHNRYLDSNGVYVLEIKVFDAVSGSGLHTENFTLNPHVQIRPNPNTGSFWIYSNEALLHYRVVNLAGQTVRETKLNEPSTSIYVENLPQGNWTFEGITLGNRTIVSRFVVE
jgi:hypothetical protein